MIRDGRFGTFGGTFAPEILVPALEQLESAFLDVQDDAEFHLTLQNLLAHYAGRPTPLYHCERLSRETGCEIYLKREDLLHGGAHKTNQVIAQALLAKRMGKTRLIAETGAGQHGVATAMIGARFGFEQVEIYMGAKDAQRQEMNVFRMQTFGAQVHRVEQGSSSLKDAINEAMRDWASSFAHTHYVLGTVAGPHPFPWMVREFQRVIGKEARAQILEQAGRLPDAIIACVGGGSNAIGIFSDFVEDHDVALVGVEAAGRGEDDGQHSRTLERGSPGILHGSRTYLLQDAHGRIQPTHSISAGLDYPGVGPEHAYLKSTGRAKYVGISDHLALDAVVRLARTEGILAALESAHAVAEGLRRAQASSGELIVINLSGRGDKDLEQIQRHLQEPNASVSRTP